MEQDIYINKQSIHVYDCLIFLFSLAKSPKLVRMLKGKGERSQKKKKNCSHCTVELEKIIRINLILVFVFIIPQPAHTVSC